MILLKMKYMNASAPVCLLIVTLLFGGLTSCQFYKEVTVADVENIDVKEFNQDRMRADVTMILDNPNWYAVTLTKSDIDIFVNEKSMGKVALTEKIKIPAKTSVSHTISLEGGFEDVKSSFLENLLTLLFAPEATFQAKGYVKGRALMIGREVPVDITEAVDLRDMNRK